LSISDVNAGAAEQPLDERDAFGLRAGQKGRALADDQRLFPELSLGCLRTDPPSNGLNPWRIKRVVAADRAQCVFAAIAAGARLAGSCARSLAFLRVPPIGFDLLL
jgi:hypothetical protein